MKRKLIVVYSRVSSGSQNLREQIDAAKKVLKIRNIEEDDVLFLEDFSVSATKNDADNRPSYKRLLELVSEGKVAVVIIYARDRAYRNFYEASEFNDFMNKHNVKVIYTASNENPYYKNSSIESFYGILSQQEGKNIRKRTTDAIKRYPGKIIGYQRIEKKLDDRRKKVNFKKDNERSYLIKQLFYEFSKIQTKEDFVTVLSKFGKKLNGHATVVKILQRPFYAAHCHTDYGYDQLDHVEPIITLAEFENVQAILNKFIKEYDEEVSRVKEKIILKPTCGICNRGMKLKKILDKPSYFVCSTGHKQVMIELQELNQNIEETIMNETKQFTLNSYKPIFHKHLKGVLNNLTHQKQHKDYLLKKSKLSFASGELSKYGSKQTNLKQEIRDLQNEIDSVDQEIASLASLKGEIDTIEKLVDPVINSLSKHELELLSELLIKDIYIYHDYLEMNMYSINNDEKGAS